MWKSPVATRVSRSVQTAPAAHAAPGAVSTKRLSAHTACPQSGEGTVRDAAGRGVALAAAFALPAPPPVPAEAAPRAWARDASSRPHPAQSARDASTPATLATAATTRSTPLALARLPAHFT